MRLKTDRSLLMYIILSVVTCGLYGIWALYTLARDINIACAGDGRHTSGLIMIIILSIITCGFYPFFWYYGVGNRLQINAQKYGTPVAENGTTVLMWMIFGSLLCGIGSFVAIHIIFKNTNVVAIGYNRENNEE